MNRVDIGNIVERVLWTSVQAFFGSVPIVLVLTGPELRVVGLSALSAVIAALISLGKNLSMERVKQGTPKVELPSVSTVMTAVDELLKPRKKQP